ncbi:PxKF domain-containing protein [Pseudarthrobacter cellobiosi]|uniref:PxKF domain-containing protein n=1 Tax=Pseudarthrobacter cellobiosi TaxID=2953654 RepID=UPI00208FE9EA|nr:MULTISPECIES: PxKF domain-containing protein [unclassified Pseudarthrobacter]MCO4256178.1 PxKF domain-containing protein [Pseudarthrobacter sp. HLT1-5]MCO4275814.1 PxKF domain-containing protein [Pseudarthrobacter sp. HLT3-5]
MNFSAVSQDAGPVKKLLRHAGLRAAAVVAAGSLLLASAGVVYADDISNTLDGSIDPVAEVMALNVGVNGTTSLQIQPRNSDGENGCNVKNAYSVTLNLVSSDPSVATVSPASVVILDCGAPGVSLTLAPLKAGSTTVTASVATNNSPGTFNLAPATFTVNVTAPAPSNAAPVLSITGVENGGSYAKGSVPAAVCNVTDAEDGPSSLPVTLSAITGPDAATGVGSQEASCDYTDGGGIYVKSSVTYSIVDASAPEISYTLSPATPDGYDGWYRSEVYLDWTVTESDSPTTLGLVGCADELISLDQLPGDYSCSATSSGGSAGPVTVSIKKDGTAPTVSYTSATGTEGNDGWYTSDVLALFTATDATSGPASATGTVSSAGEGSAVAVLSPEFQDNAGNTTLAGNASHSFKIDKTAPEVSYTGVTGTAGTNGWFRSDVVATFTGTDDTSGPLAATKTVTSEGEGESVVVQSPAFEDVAGNVTPAGADQSSFKIDKTAPSVAFSSTVNTGYYGATAPAPTCIASDALSGLAGCVVSGYGTSVGPHTVTATATDNAGNRTTVTQDYTVLAWTLKGFYQPVDMNGVLNTVKGGSTIPAKFEVFAGTRELTDPGLVSFAAAKIQCTLEFMDDIEVTATGNTSLRYDATAGQFIYNWKTPTGAGTCYRLTMTAADGSFITANFKLK